MIVKIKLEQLYEAFKYIDGGCKSCMCSFLKKLPRSLALELMNFHNNQEGIYFKFALDEHNQISTTK